MSITNFIHQSGSTGPAQPWTDIKVHRVNAQNLLIDNVPLAFKNSDITISVNTYDGADNLVASDVFSLNIHVVKINNSVILTLPELSYEATVAFNYFGFQLPVDYIPIIINNGLMLSYLNGTFQVSKFVVTNSGEIRIAKNLSSDDFAIGDIFLAYQQNIGYGTTN